MYVSKYYRCRESTFIDALEERLLTRINTETLLARRSQTMEQSKRQAYFAGSEEGNIFVGGTLKSFTLSRSKVIINYFELSQLRRTV